MRFAQHTQKSAHSESCTKSRVAKYPSLRGVYADGYSGDANKTLAIFDMFDSGYKALIECDSTADICYTGCSKLLNCWITWLEEREYDEDGEYELTGHVCQAIESEV